MQGWSDAGATLALKRSSTKEFRTRLILKKMIKCLQERRLME